MAFISDEDVQKVREASDIVAVIGERSPVKQRGRDFWCCCPLHNEKTPSLKIDPALQLWHCFGCGEGGDVFGFVMKADDLSFPEAVRKLADRAHIEISADARGAGVPRSRKERLKAVCAATRDFYHTQLMRGKSPEAGNARSYLAGRGLGGSIPKTWQLGFAPGRGALVRYLLSKGFKPDELVEANVALAKDDGKLRDRFYNRVMFPISDAQGECIAFGGRIVGEGQPKYLNSNETPLFHKSTVLYGLDQAKNALVSSGVAIVVEGYTDVIALSTAGVKNVVATLGTSLTRQHIRLLSRYVKHRIVYLFDGDAAGQRAADRALEFIDDSMTPEAGRRQVELFACTLPDDLDPADFVAQRGAEALRACIEDAKPLIQYGIDRRIAAHDLSRPEGRASALADALAILAPIKGSLLAKDYAVQIAGRTRAREEDALDALAQLKASRSQANVDGASDGFARSRDDRARGGSIETSHAAAASPGIEPGSAEGAARSRRPAVSREEANRLRLERQLLCVAAQHPQTALLHADAIAGTRWHDPLHAALADAMLSALVENPASTPAALVAASQRADARAASVLTSAGVPQGSTPEATAAFLAEELALGDLEDAIADIKALLSDPSRAASDEDEGLFATVVGMQKDLARRRAAHRPLA